MLISYFCNFLFLSPVGVVVAVELGQRELLQFDLQLLVLPLQVHDHAVQEVDLMETIRWELIWTWTDLMKRMSAASWRSYLSLRELLLFPQLLQSCIACRRESESRLTKWNYSGKVWALWSSSPHLRSELQCLLPLRPAFPWAFAPDCERDSAAELCLSAASPRPTAASWPRRFLLAARRSAATETTGQPITQPSLQQPPQAWY